MAEGVCEPLWLKGLFEDLGVSIPVHMILYCDNRPLLVLLTIVYIMIVRNM